MSGYEDDDDDDFDADYDEPQRDYRMEWDPDFGMGAETESVSMPTSPNSNGMKAVAAIGLLSTGVFLITKGLSRKTKE